MADQHLSTNFVVNQLSGFRETSFTRRTDERPTDARVMKVAVLDILIYG